MRAILFTFAMLCAIGGGFVLLALIDQEGAAQQGAVAALAVALAVIPYCLARSYQELTRLAYEKRLADDIGHAVADALNQQRRSYDSEPLRPEPRAEKAEARYTLKT